jgi:hypothetical protein
MRTMKAVLLNGQCGFDQLEYRASIHPLSAIVDAQREFLEKRHTGKIVLIP